MRTVDVRIQPPRSLDRSVEAEGGRQAPPFEQRGRKACLRTWKPRIQSSAPLILTLPASAP
jgi:hypothetical protein